MTPRPRPLIADLSNPPALSHVETPTALSKDDAMTDTRIRYTATYDYPGSFFPETATRAVPEATFDAAVAAGPDEDGWFRKDGWYAVTITATVEKLFRADDGAEAWVKQSADVVGKWIVGERVHYSEIEDTDRNAILISNIRSNTKYGYGVHTRAGNWQFADDYDGVVTPVEAAR